MRIDENELTYDADGNLLGYDGWNYSWTPEGRLNSVIKGNTKVVFEYDYLGRRFEKKVYIDEALIIHHRFVYDGYKLIAVYDAANNNMLLMSFVWQPEMIGLDVPLLMIYNGPHLSTIFKMA